MAGMKRLILYCFIFSAAWEAGAQELQFSQPEQLGTVINSDDEELVPMLSPDGQTLYFSRAFHSENIGGKYAGTDIWISRKDANGNWTPAVNAGKPWNNKRSNAVIGISADCTTVYLLNAYNNKSGISFSKLVAGTWTKPEFIAVPGINRDDFVSIYVHPSFDLMLISMKGKASYGEEDLYVSLKDSLGNWNQPQNLGPSINTSGFEISPFLSSDKKRLYFSSNGHTGLGGADIFYSDRLYDSWETWTTPKNLGEKINTRGFEGYYSVQNNALGIYTSSVGNNLNIFLCSVFTTEKPKPIRRVMTQTELEKIFGGNVFYRFDFEKDLVTPSSAQQEMLWYLASKALPLKDITLEVKVVEENRPDLTNIRIKAVSDYLRTAGLESVRIIVPESQTLVKTTEKTSIDIIFYKEGY